jgi:hypothetical protein
MVLIASCGLLAPAAALADTAAAGDAPVATAQGAPAPPVTTEAQIQTFIHDDESDQPPPPRRDRKPHGFVTAGIGTNGYRQVGGLVVMPIGDNGELAVAIDYTTIGGRRR